MGILSNEISSQIFRDGVLNIFTDASIKPLGNNTWDGCSGAISVINSSEEEYDRKVVIIRNCTNNIAELTAIELGVDLAIENIGKFRRINLFSDSKISVLGLRDWIWSWIKYSDNDMRTMRTSSGTPVKNLNIILNIINKISMIDPELSQFNIYHCKGHALGKEELIKKTFKEVNGITINTKDASKLGEYNDVVDNLTRDTLYLYSDLAEEISVIPFSIHPMKMGMYRKIIGRRSFTW